MPRIVNGLIARSYGLLDGLLKTPPLLVPKQRLKFAGSPILRPVPYNLLQVLKRLTAKYGNVPFSNKTPFTAKRLSCNSRSGED